MSVKVPLIVFFLPIPKISSRLPGIAEIPEMQLIRDSPSEKLCLCFFFSITGEREEIFGIGKKGYFGGSFTLILHLLESSLYEN